MAEESHEVREIVAGRLYTIVEDGFSEDLLEDVTVLIDLSKDPGLTINSGSCLLVSWATSSDVDQNIFEGLVRLCASSMMGKSQRVLVVGAQDTIDTVAACVLKEYLGCNSQTAVNIIREGRTFCLNKSMLIETINGYKPS